MTAKGKLERLIPFAELLAATPVSERKLRDVIRELGFKAPKKGAKLMFKIEDARRIQDAVACRSSSPSQNDGSPVGSLPLSRSEKTQRTKRLVDGLRPQRKLDD